METQHIGIAELHHVDHEIIVIVAQTAKHLLRFGQHVLRLVLFPIVQRAKVFQLLWCPREVMVGIKSQNVITHGCVLFHVSVEI